MKRSRWYILAGIVGVFISAALLAAACDGDDEDDDDGGNGDRGTIPTATVAAGGGETSESSNGDGGEGATVDVDLQAFEVKPSVDKVAAGAVTFNVTNVGTRVHNLRVIKSDREPDALPLNESGTAVDEPQVDVLASTADLSAGDSEGIILDLEQGDYVLICNIERHYQAGMRAGFTVE